MKFIQKHVSWVRKSWNTCSLYIVVLVKEHACCVSDIDESRIYWTSSGASDKSVYSSFLNGSDLQKTGVGLEVVGSIDVSSTYIYALTNRGIDAIEKSNSTSNVLLYETNLVTAIRIFKPEGRFLKFFTSH